MRNQRGITLIALIVTIIVLIIIAGISIATLTSDNGILRQVDSAKVATIEGNAREEVTLAMGALRIAIAEAQSRDNSYKAKDHVATIQLSMLKLLNADTQLSNKADFASVKVGETYPTTKGWTTATPVKADSTVEDATTNFTVQYTGDDYQNACNNTNALITYEISLTQSSIDCTDISATGIKGATGSNGTVIKPTDIGGRNLVNGMNY